MINFQAFVEDVPIRPDGDVDLKEKDFTQFVIPGCPKCSGSYIWLKSYSHIYRIQVSWNQRLYSLAKMFQQSEWLTVMKKSKR